MSKGLPYLSRIVGSDLKQYPESMFYTQVQECHIRKCVMKRKWRGRVEDVWRAMVRWGAVIERYDDQTVRKPEGNQNREGDDAGCGTVTTPSECVTVL